MKLIALMHKPRLTKPTEGRTIAVSGDVYRFIALGEDTDGKYALWETIVPPGGGPPPHVHSREEEGFYVLEGEITFQIGGEQLVAGAGRSPTCPLGHHTRSRTRATDRPRCSFPSPRPGWSGCSLR